MALTGAQRALKRRRPLPQEPCSFLPGVGRRLPPPPAPSARLRGPGFASTGLGRAEKALSANDPSGARVRCLHSYGVARERSAWRSSFSGKELLYVSMPAWP